MIHAVFLAETAIPVLRTLRVPVIETSASMPLHLAELPYLLDSNVHPVFICKNGGSNMPSNSVLYPILSNMWAVFRHIVCHSALRESA